MANLSHKAATILWEAANAFPEKIKAPENTESDEYAVFAELHRLEYLSGANWEQEGARISNTGFDRLNETDEWILTFAALSVAEKKYPSGIESPDRPNPYKAFIHCIDSGLIDGEPIHELGDEYPRYYNSRITPFGRTSLRELKEKLLEFEILQEAKDAAPRGINGPDDHDSDRYKAMFRLIRRGALDAGQEWHEEGKAGPCYASVNITSYGEVIIIGTEDDVDQQTGNVNVTQNIREVKGNVTGQGDISGDVANTNVEVKVYGDLIIRFLEENPQAMQADPKDIARSKELVREAPAEKIREVIDWICRCTTLGQLAAKILQTCAI